MRMSHSPIRTGNKKHCSWWHKHSVDHVVCPVNKSQTASLQYVVDNCFRKISDVKSTEIVRHCMSEFKWLTMCDMIDIKKFLEKFSLSENSLCQVIVHMCNPR